MEKITNGVEETPKTPESRTNAVVQSVRAWIVAIALSVSAGWVQAGESEVYKIPELGNRTAKMIDGVEHVREISYLTGEKEILWTPRSEFERKMASINEENVRKTNRDVKELGNNRNGRAVLISSTDTWY